MPVTPLPSAATEKKTENGPVDLKDAEKSIVGIWSDSMSVGNVGYVVILEFKEDGTFDKGMGSISGYVRSAQGVTGRYRISEGKLILYNQLKSVSRTATETDKNYWALIVGQDLAKDIPIDDEEYQISISDGKLSLSRESDGSIVTTTYTRATE